MVLFGCFVSSGSGSEGQQAERPSQLHGVSAQHAEQALRHQACGNRRHIPHRKRQGQLPRHGMQQLVFGHRVRLVCGVCGPFQSFGAHGFCFEKPTAKRLNPREVPEPLFVHAMLEFSGRGWGLRPQRQRESRATHVYKYRNHIF